MKRVLALILAVFIMVSLCACKKDETKATAFKVTPLLYKVTEFDGDVVWILGSVHCNKEDIYPLPDYVYDALDNSDYLAVECDIVSAEQNPQTLNLMYSYLLYEDGSSIRDHIPPELYESAVKVMKEIGAYNPLWEFYKPALWSNFIDSYNYNYIGYDFFLGVDRHLMARAQKNNIKLREIESVFSQYFMLSNYSEGLQKRLLEDSISYHKTDKLKEDIDTLYRSWCTGDEETLTRYTNEIMSYDSCSENEKLLYEEYNGAMYTKRNYVMANYAEKALKHSEEAFICVGVLHVVGERGIISILEDRGYTVEIVR